MLEKTNAFYERYKKPLAYVSEIDFNKDINAINEHGYNILLLACREHEYEVVRELLAVEGIDIFKRNNAGHNAMTITLWHKTDICTAYDIIKMLTNHPDFLLAARSITDIKANQGDNNEQD